MRKTIQIRNIPIKVHRRLKAKAAMTGLSLSAYLLKEIGDIAERPTIEDLRCRLASREPVSLSISPTDAVRALGGT
jgi:antitoxin FitA